MTPTEAADLLYRVWDRLRDAAERAPEHGPFSWFDYQEAKGTVSVLAWAVEHPWYKPTSPLFRSRWPYPLTSDNQNSTDPGAKPEQRRLY